MRWYISQVETNYPHTATNTAEKSFVIVPQGTRIRRFSDINVLWIGWAPIQWGISQYSRNSSAIFFQSSHVEGGRPHSLKTFQISSQTSIIMPWMVDRPILIANSKSLWLFPVARYRNVTAYFVTLSLATNLPNDQIFLETLEHIKKTTFYKKIVFFSEEQRRLSYSKKVRSNCLANRKVVEKAPSWDLFQLIAFTQSLICSFIYSIWTSSSPS